MPRNDAAADGHVCPGIRIHTIDIVQPPGIGIPPIADMDVHQMIATAALPAKNTAETPKNACWEARSEAIRRNLRSRNVRLSALSAFSARGRRARRETAETI